jgi:hypothetical protein
MNPISLKTNFARILKNRTTQTPNPQSKPKKCTPFKPCLQQNTGIFSKFDKTGVNYPITILSITHQGIKRHQSV